MAIFVGAALALCVSLFASVVRLDRDRAFYATVTIVVATYYALFAVQGGSTDALLKECAGIAVFVTLAVIGFRVNLWFVVAGLAGHGLLDMVHGHVIENAGVPAWWPMFCSTYDVTAAAYLAWLIKSGRVVARA